MTDTAAPVPGPTQEAPARLDARPDALPGADLAGAPATVPALDPLAPYDAILLQSYGGPRRPEDVLPFMRNATAGRGVPDSRLVEVSGHYQSVGGASPINACNAELRDALQARLAERGSTLPIIVGNRNWHPFVSQALRELADAGARRVLALPTAAFGSYSGCRQYREDLAGAVALLADGADGSTGEGFEADAAARVGGDGGGPVELTADKTRPYYNTPGLLQANIDAIVEAYGALAEQGVAAADARLVLVTHSIPLGMEAGSAPEAGPKSAPGASGASDAHDPTGAGRREPGVAADLSTEVSYVAQHEALAAVLVPEVARRLGLDTVEADLVYCSRSGPPQARWLEPDVNDHLEALAAGHLTDGRPVDRPGGVVVAPFGFISDHMEVVFDLDTEAAQTARDLGMPYARAATVGTHPAFVDSLVDILFERAATARGEDVRPDSTTGVGPFHTVCPDSCCRNGGRHPGRPAHHGTDGAGPDSPHPSSSDTNQEKRMSTDTHGQHGHPGGHSGEGGLHRFEDEERRPHRDPRDATDVDLEAINNQYHYTLYSVFRLTRPLPASQPEREQLLGESANFVEAGGVTTRGWYDVGGLRADADLLVWWLDDDPEVLQDAYHRLRGSALGRYLEPVWSCMGLHTPAEFNPRHVPACLAGVAPRDWVMVYPFVRSYEWYLLDPEERSRMMAQHGRHGFSKYPDVKGSTLSTFGLSDYEWILGFEADSLDRLEGVLHHQRYTEARMHVRVDTPFYTGRRVSPQEWAQRQPWA
ncbi:hydrogen peroxide-dependent heme synthase [Actinomyces oris]|uniref:hydrogen peroxide-dependent heme synthase n=1 Tax=Actinomyces oris TaxID=544580 RepID=UPI002805AA72|nr:hydrogen peroxide-dependent heme synthase [Actinomyces oris]MDR0180623.1 ferrochelatase [Actinomyces oris]